jgi:regulator of replication initiation timing
MRLEYYGGESLLFLLVINFVRSAEELQRRIHELEEENNHLKILLQHYQNRPPNVAEKFENEEEKSSSSKDSTLALRIQPLFRY